MSDNSGSGMDKLRSAGQGTAKALGDRAMGMVTDRVGDMTTKLTETAAGNASGPAGKAMAEGGKAAAQGDNPAVGALKGAVGGIKDKITGGGGGEGGGGGKATKAINIVEDTDVGVPLRVAYNQWTTYGDFPTMMKKMEKGNLEDADEGDALKANFGVQIFLSHRQWEAKITHQIPDERIVWTSEGAKGHVNGTVTFHDLGPNLTRILVVLEYYPKGFFEWWGNRWRAQGRRARLEIKNFRRHVMTRTILDPEELEGWRGTVIDGEIVTTHDDAVEQEQQEAEESEDEGYEDEAAEDEGYEDEESEDEYEEEPAEDEASEGEYEEEPAEDEAAAEEYEEEPAEDESEEEPAEEEPAEEAPAKKSASKRSTAKKAPAKKSASKRSSRRRQPAS